MALAFGRRLKSTGATPKFRHRGFLQWLTCIPAAAGGNRGLAGVDPGEDIFSDKKKPPVVDWG